MSGIRGHVEVEEHWHEYEVALHNAVKEALSQAADVGLAAVKATPTGGYKIEGIIAKVFRSGVERTSKGAGVWLIGQDWRSIFFEHGTYTRRKKPVSAATARRRTSSSGQARVNNWNGNPGVYAIYFITRGARAARKVLPGMIEREFSKIRIG